jgi:hypothetical protein
MKAIGKTEMTVTQQRKILTRISELESDIETLRKVRIELATSEYVSATLSSQGGSKSYTRLDFDKISKLLAELENELQQYKSILSSGRGKTIGTIVTIYS